MIERGFGEMALECGRRSGERSERFAQAAHSLRQFSSHDFLSDFAKAGESTILSAAVL